MFAGMDVHKKFLQITIMNKKSKLILNGKVENENKIIKRFFKSSTHENEKIYIII